jgi:rhodanese-related sulfurtransferase
MKTLLSSVALLLLVGTALAAATEETPSSIPGGTYITADQAKQRFDKGVPFVDARVAAEYADKHIKGAISVPYKEKFAKVSTVDAGDQFDVSKVPAGPVVFYCNGSPCWKAYKAAAATIKAGHKDVMWFRDGMPAWLAKGLPTE